jgi:hypothetical protein
MRAACPGLFRGALILLVLTAPAAAQQKPVLTPADYAKWESLGHTALSPDGRWIAYVVNRVDEDDELRWNGVAGDSVRVVPNGSNPAFSSDGRWLAYSIGLSRRELERRQSDGRPTHGWVGIVDLRSGRTAEVPRISSHAFSGDGRFIVLRGYASAETDGRTTDIVVRELDTGVDVNFGNIAEYAWQDRGALLAMVVDAAGRVGNGVRLYDARTGTIRTLDSDTAEYRGLGWRRDADDLAVLRVLGDTVNAGPDHAILAWRGLSGSRPSDFRLDPRARADVPQGQRIADARSPSWSRDGATVFFGLRDRPAPPADTVPSDTMPADTAAPPRRTEEPAGVEVWHARDVDIIPEQKVRAGIESVRSRLAAWHLREDRVVALAADLAEDVTLSDGRTALVLDGRPWGRERMFGPAYRDLYASTSRPASARSPRNASSSRPASRRRPVRAVRAGRPLLDVRHALGPAPHQHHGGSCRRRSSTSRTTTPSRRSRPTARRLDDGTTAVRAAL